MKRPRRRWISSAAAAATMVAALWTGVAAMAAGPASQEPTYGPVLEDFGPVYYMGAVDLATPLDVDFKALFDVSDAADEPEAGSPAITAAARFLNMHAQAGVPLERLGAAIVLHGGAARWALSHEAYRERYEIDNPNLPLIEALRAAGVRFAICGQTAAARGYTKDELAGPIELALSAMTAIKVLQDDGYQIVSF
jgi:intracellular sulfur oxidation DsrE/DsrF family protein